MQNQPIKKKELLVKTPVLVRKLPIPVVSYEATTLISEVEIQQRLDRIFKIIFDEVVKRREEKNRQLQTGEYILQKYER